MPKSISILILGPEVEPRQVVGAIPDLDLEVLSHVLIKALVPPNEQFGATREFMFETTGELTADGVASIEMRLFSSLVLDLGFGTMHSFTPVEIGVRRPDSGQGRGTVEIFDRR